MVLRPGYETNSNLAQSGSMIQNSAFQPPFAEAETNSTNVNDLVAGNPLTLTNAFPPVSPTTITNNFAVNPNYRLGYVQVCNLDVQQEFPAGVVMNLGHNGPKETRLVLD